MTLRTTYLQIRWRSLVVATLAGLMLLALIVALVTLYVRERDQSHAFNAETLANGELMATRSALESALYKRLSLPIALEAFVKANPGFTARDFENFAHSLKESVPGVMSLQLAPDAVVTYLTDVERNRAAIGHDLIADPARRPAVLRSIEERKFIVAGPLTLKQGGLAIIARLPIFLEGFESRTGFDEFWGFATILIDVDALFADAGLGGIDPRVDLAIRGVDALGTDGALIVGEAGVFDTASTFAEVVLPNGSWQLAAVPNEKAFVRDTSWFFLGAILGGVLLVGLISVLVYRQGSRELLNAKEQAEAASKLKSDFIAVMSHEMRTPLNGILGAVDLLRSTELTEEQSTYADTASTAGEHLLRQINDVLDVSRAETGSLRLESTPIDVEEIVGNAIQVTGSAATSRNLKLVSTLTAPDHALTGDSHRIRQVLVNLIGNAVKFTDAGRITVQATPRRQEHGLTEMEFSVIDSGIGIPEDQQGRVFDDFVTLETGYARNADGSGLGLAISRRIVQAMGGEIGVESTPGVGSRFWFRLPLRWDDTAARTAEDAVPAAHGAVPLRDGPVAPLDILLVEDNETNRMVARELLTRAGHAITEARDGLEGVEMAQGRAYDVILMDVSMPRMDGIKATEAIRAGHGPNCRTPIVGLTAHAMPGECARFRKAGMSACLSKPIRVQQLYEAVAQNAPGAEAGSEAQKCTAVDGRVLDELGDVLSPLAFRTTLDKVCAEIEAAVPALIALDRAGDVEALGKAAHKLAGSAALVGAVALRGTLGEIEEAAKLRGAGLDDAAGERLGRVAEATVAALTRKAASLDAAA
ncbi:ATP-binding protein [Marinovum sp.]|uniref:hybrid sensor histidine kinase/response regulator n=1 Tax=Marinovum sp. TaxID=2024839 RepID=UPI003A915C9C